MIGISGSLIWTKTPIELIINSSPPRWCPRDLLRSVQMLKRELGAQSNRKLPHLSIPSKTATLVPGLQWKTHSWAEHSRDDDYDDITSTNSFIRYRILPPPYRCFFLRDYATRALHSNDLSGVGINWDQLNAGAISETTWTWKAIRTSMHPFKANMKGRLWRPNDIRKIIRA